MYDMLGLVKKGKVHCNVYCRGVARVWSASVQYASAHLITVFWL